MFKKKGKDPRRSNEPLEGGRRAGENENPYVTARRSWNEHVGSVVSSRQTWQIIGILSLLIVLTSVGGLIHIAGKSTFIPYIIEVDQFGQASAVGPMNGSGNRSEETKELIIHASVSDFIVNARTVTPDIALQRRGILRIYGKLSPNDPATMKMNEWLNGSEDSSPFKRAETEMVEVKIETVLRQTADTWQVDWVETIRNREGVREVEPLKLRALITVYEAQRTPQTTQEQMQVNPFGIYVRDYSWSRLL